MNCRERNCESDREMPWWGWALLVSSLIAAWALVMAWLLRYRARGREALPVKLSRPESTRLPVAAFELDEEEVAAGPVRDMEPVPDELERIKGIGPKIAAVLQTAGITTFARLAAMNAEQLIGIVAEAGIRLAFPDTWPEQAALAAAGRWADLEELQGQLKGGRRV